MKDNIHLMFSSEFNTELKVIEWEKFKEVFQVTTQRSTYFKKLTPNVDYIEQDGKYYLLLASAISLASTSRAEDKKDNIYYLTAELYSDNSVYAGKLVQAMEEKLHGIYNNFVGTIQEDLRLLGSGIGNTLNATYTAMNYGSMDNIIETLNSEQVVITEPTLPEDKYPMEPIITTEEETDYDN